MQIVSEWAAELSKKLNRPESSILENGLSALDFSTSASVEITFPDHSFCRFRYAFAIVTEPKKAVAIFTEHCGYYVFPIYGLQVKEINERIYQNDAYES